MDRILVVKLADLGDLLTATPALRALRRRFPAAEISALVTPHTASLLHHNDSVDTIITLPKRTFDRVLKLANPRVTAPALRQAVAAFQALRAPRFDTVVLLHHLTTRWGCLKYRALLAAVNAPVRAGLDNGHGSFLTLRAPDRGFGVRHEVDYCLDVVGTLGATSADARLELHLTPDEQAQGLRRWQQAAFDLRPVVLLHPGSGRFGLARRWAPQNYAAVGDALTADGMAVGIIAGPGEEPLASDVQHRMRGPAVVFSDLEGPRALAAVLAQACLFVGNDGGVMHCAAAMGVPTVAVFGLSNHLAWGPYPPALHRVVRLDLPCSPCFYTGTTLGNPQGCAARTCLTELAPHTVIAAARELRNDRAVRSPGDQ